MTADLTAVEEALAALRRDPQRHRLWHRHLGFRRFVRHWADWRALVAGDTMPPRFLAARGSLLQKNWAEIAAFFARYEANRGRLDALRGANGVQRASLLEGAVQAWTWLEKEAYFAGDPSVFAPLEEALDAAEAEARPTAAAALEAPAPPERADLRGQAKDLLDESMALVRRLGFRGQTRASAMQERRRILELLENGESVRAFWWTKDLHTWLRLSAKNVRTPPSNQAGRTAASFATRHARFVEIQSRLKRSLSAS